MHLGITLEKIVVTVRLAHDRTDNILAFGELWFFEDDRKEPFIKVKGFTIKSKEFKGKKTLTADFPAFPSKLSKTGYKTSFVFEDLSLVEDVRKMFLSEFSQASGGLSSTEAEELQDSEISGELSGELSEEEIENISNEIDKENPQL